MEVYKNGNITVYNDDCMNVMKTLPDESIDLVCTDPPYRVTPSGTAGSAGGMLTKKQYLSGKVFGFNDIDCSVYAPEFFRILKDGSHCYVMTNNVNLIHMLNVFTETGFHFIKSLIWDKGNKIMGQFYMSQFEYILFFRKGYGKKINNCGTSDILSIPNDKVKDAEGNNLHDTEKPVDLMKVLVENSTEKGGVVLDPFSGSGSTMLACLQTGRVGIGCEIDPDFFSVIQKRIDSGSRIVDYSRETKGLDRASFSDLL